MTVLLALLMRHGLPQRLAAVAAYVVAVLGGAALVALLCWALIAHGQTLGRQACEAAQQAASNATLIRNDAAKDQAAIDRINDSAVIANQQEEIDHAIDQAPTGASGAATLAANCVLWRRQHPGAVPPAPCR